MRRSRAGGWILKVGVALVVGVMVTWLMAWGCALWAKPQRGPFVSQRDVIPVGFPVVLSESWIPTLPPPVELTVGGQAPGTAGPYDFNGLFPPTKYRKYVCEQQSGFGVLATTCWVEDVDERLHINRSAGPPHAVFVQLGWPWPALQGAVELDNGVGRSVWSRGMIEVPVRFRSRVSGAGVVNVKGTRYLAGEVRWDGFAWNTPLAAVLMLGLLEAAGLWQRWRRRKNGLCGWCAYDRSGLVGPVACPECGRMG